MADAIIIFLLGLIAIVSLRRANRWQAKYYAELRAHAETKNRHDAQLAIAAGHLEKYGADLYIGGRKIEPPRKVERKIDVRGEAVERSSEDYQFSGGPVPQFDTPEEWPNLIGEK